MSVIFPFSKVFVVILFMFWCNALLWMGNYYLLIFLFSSEFSWNSKMEEFPWKYLHYPWTNVWPHVTFLGLYRIESLDSSSFTPRKALHGHGYETYDLKCVLYCFHVNLSWHCLGITHELVENDLQQGKSLVINNPLSNKSIGLRYFLDCSSQKYYWYIILSCLLTQAFFFTLRSL